MLLPWRGVTDLPSRKPYSWRGGGHLLGCHSIFQAADQELPGYKQAHAPASGFHAKSKFQFSHVLQRDFTRDRHYVLENVKVQGQNHHLWPLKSSLLKLQRARSTAEALHSLKPLGKCGVVGAQAVGSDRRGLNPSSTAF